MTGFLKKKRIIVRKGVKASPMKNLEKGRWKTRTIDGKFEARPDTRYIFKTFQYEILKNKSSSEKQKQKKKQ